MFFTTSWATVFLFNALLISSWSQKTVAKTALQVAVRPDAMGAQLTNFSPDLSKLALLQKLKAELTDENYDIAGDLLQLPQIVVVGPQSAGKSSTLEMIAGIHFLPRGTEMVTTRPFLINFIPLPVGEPKPYAKVNDGGEITTHDISKLPEFLMKANPKKEISPKTLVIELYLADVDMNFTLIDLPGLIQNAIEDYPADLPQQIRELVLTYSKSENTIMLVAHDSSTDIANNAAIDFVKELDPTGERTIGVLTKLNKEDSCGIRLIKNVDILRNKSLPLKKFGWHGITGQNPAEVEAKADMEETRMNEETFFATEQFKDHDVAANLGYKNLVHTIQTALTEHAAMLMPKLRSKFKEQLRKAKEEQGTIPSPPPSSRATRKSHIDRHYVQEIQSSLRHQLDPRLSPSKLVNTYNSLFKHFTADTASAEGAETGQTNAEQYSACTSTGSALHGANRYPCFQFLYEPEVDKLYTMCEHAMDTISKHFLGMVSESTSKVSRGKIGDRLKRHLDDMLQTYFLQRIKLVKNYVEERVNGVERKHGYLLVDHLSGHCKKAKATENALNVSELQCVVGKLISRSKKSTWETVIKAWE